MTTNLLDNPKEFWKTVLGEVELKISPIPFKTFVARTMAEDISEDTIRVFSDDDLIRKTIETKYRSILETAVRKLAKKDLKLEITVGKIQHTSKVTTPAELGPLFQNQKDAGTVLKEKQDKAKISPRFTFENYIMGKNNNMAYAIATAVAEKPGELYNPVFIYSGVGLGKTHLLQAIGNQILKTKPGMKVIYTTGEAFSNELIESIQSGKGRGKYTTNEFRNKFRKADVFLIDDIQFVIGRTSTQEEFFHTFNELHMAQKQIVITSDRPPKEFNNIEARISSRFGSGIIADIQSPDLEMRIAILRNKRDENKDPIPNDIIDYVAEKVDSNIRELEGAYMQILTKTRANGGTISLENAAEALGQSIREKEKIVNINQILKAVCSYYSVKMIDLKGKKRTKDLVLPRHITMYLIKELTNTPYMAIGEFLGGRDHTTIMHGVEKIEGEGKKLGKIKQDLTNVKQIIYTN